MKPFICLRKDGRIWSLIPPALSIALLLWFGFLNTASSTTNIVTTLADNDSGSLRQTIANCTPGDSIIFAIRGTLTLASGPLIANKNLTIVGPGSSTLTVSGTSRVFYVATNVHLTLSDLTIANGRADKGGGIYNAGGEVFLFRCLFVSNSAVGPSAASYSGNPGTNGCGGAVFNSGRLTAINCTFLSNSVVGGDGGAGAMPSFAGGVGGDGNGGAIANTGILLMSGCLLAHNTASGGAGGSGMAGFYGCPGESGGAGGDGGFGNGGALFNTGSANLVNNTFAINVAAGGDGGGGGSGGPPMSQSCWSGDGGHGGVGGSGYSAVYDANGQCYFTNCTVALNIALPGLGGAGGPAGPWPYPHTPRVGSPGASGSNGSLGGALKTSGAHLLNTLLSSNVPMNCVGPAIDNGHNISSDGSCCFTNVGSVNNRDPRSSPVADNGGPTFTMALLSNSPAIDAGSFAGAPTTDQRGVPRPQGAGVDIGAFEYQFVPMFMSARFSPTNFALHIMGPPDQSYALQYSSNLMSWLNLTNLAVGSNSTCEFLDDNFSDRHSRFYRLRQAEP